MTTRLFATAACLALASALAAQDLPGTGTVPFDNRIGTGDLDVPAPPRGAADRLVKHGRITVPEGGPGIPLPPVPETRIEESSPLGGTANDLVFAPPGLPPLGSTSTTAPEPTVCSPDSMDTLFSTANWRASLSTTGGQTWTSLNPYTRFPSLEGGFCCDQWAISKNQGTYWFLQYSTTSGGTNAVRIAVAPTVTALRAGSFFNGVVFRASNFGYSTNDWLDFPDLAATNTYLYASSNVFAVGTNSYRGAVVWRMPLSELNSGASTVNFSFYTEATTIRLTHGAESTMWFGMPNSTSSLRVYSWADNSTTRTAPGIRTIAAYAFPSGNTSSTGPDGRGWSGAADARLFGGCYLPARFRENPRYAFYWMSDPIGSYTRMHVRGAIFDAVTNALVEQPVIWNSSYGIGYPAVAANSFGHRGVVFAYGGPTQHVSTGIQVDDDLGTASIGLLSGSMGPEGNRFGDYFSVQSGGGFSTHPEFLCSTAARGSNGTMLAMAMRAYRRAFADGSIGITASVYPRNLTAAVGMSPADQFGTGTGTLPFCRSVPKTTGSYTFTADPLARDANNRRYAFQRWHRQFAPYQAYAAQPDGQRAYTMTTGNATFPTALVAEYAALYEINITSNVPATVTLSPADYSGLTSVSLPKVVLFTSGSSTTITAPLTTPNFDRFVRWTLNGTAQPLGQLAVSINNITGDHQLVATYQRFTRSTIGNVGAGCPGSNGTPAHNVTSAAAGGVQIGAVNDYSVSNARGNSVAVLALGVSTATWLGIPLPLNLVGVGAPNCFLRNDLAVTINAPTNAAGSATLPINCPNDVNLIGGTHYTTFLSLDPGFNQLGLVLSNCRSIQLGGLQ